MLSRERTHRPLAAAIVTIGLATGFGTVVVSGPGPGQIVTRHDPAPPGNCYAGAGGCAPGLLPGVNPGGPMRPAGPTG